MVSRLDEAYFHGSHINPIYLTATSPRALLGDWPRLDQIQTKPPHSVHPLHLNVKGNEASHRRLASSKLVFLYLGVYPVPEDDVIPRAIFYFSKRERNTDRMGMSKFKTRITFPTDPSDFVTSFILRSQCSFHVVLTLAKARVLFFSFFSFISPRLASSAAPSGTVRIEVNMSVWNEMLPISCGRSRLYVACYSRRNNTVACTDLWSNLCENMNVWLWSEISWGKKKEMGGKLLQIQSLSQPPILSLCAFDRGRWLINRLLQSWLWISAPFFLEYFKNTSYTLNE